MSSIANSAINTKNMTHSFLQKVRVHYLCMYCIYCIIDEHEPISYNPLNNVALPVPNPNQTISPDSTLLSDK